MTLVTIDEKLKKKAEVTLKNTIDNAFGIMYDEFRGNSISLDHAWFLHIPARKTNVNGMNGVGPEFEIRVNVGMIMDVLRERIKTHYLSKFQQAAIDEFMAKIEAIGDDENQS